MGIQTDSDLTKDIYNNLPFTYTLNPEQMGTMYGEINDEDIKESSSKCTQIKAQTQMVSTAYSTKNVGVL